MTLEIKYNRGTHGDSSHMLSTVVLSNENQTCRGWEAPTSTGGGGCHVILKIKRVILDKRWKSYRRLYK